MIRERESTGTNIYNEALRNIVEHSVITSLTDSPRSNPRRKEEFSEGRLKGKIYSLKPLATDFPPSLGLCTGYTVKHHALRVLVTRKS